MMYKHRLRTRTLSLLMVVLMLLSLAPLSAFAAEGDPTVVVGTGSALPGGTVSIDVALKNNPGVSTGSLKVTFDESILSLQAVTFGDDFADSTQPQTMASPVTLSWSELSDVCGDVTVATLTFLVSETAAEGTTDITLSELDIINVNEATVDFQIENGSVEVVTGVPGDINGDGVRSSADLLRARKYFAGWNVEADQIALDANGDGEVNSKDLLRLRKFYANWDVVIWYGKISYSRSTRSLTSVAYNAPTCEEAGNILYYYDNDSGKYYSDSNGTTEITLEDTVIEATGHTPVTDPAVPATYESTGLTEGSHCDVCKKVLVAQDVTPVLTRAQWNITYNIAGNDSYLQSITIENPNPSFYEEGIGLILEELEVAGYIFEGWYDGQGSAANRVTQISTTEARNIKLYAKWSKSEYNINFVSSLYPIDSITYTADTGVVLPTPSLSNYVFVGWTDENGNLLTDNVIKPGTAQNMTLTANWTSERNKTVTKKNLGDPIIYEDMDNNIVYFAYEIGEVTNVPLYVIKDFGYISGDGVTKSETTTYSFTTDETLVESYSTAVAKSTTQSSNWTLSSGWSDSTSVDQSLYTEHEVDYQNAITKGKSDTGTWNVSSGSAGSQQTTHLDTNQSDTTSEVKVTGSSSTTDSDKMAAGLTTELGVEEFGVSAKVGAEISAEESHSTTNTSGMEVGGTLGSSNLSTDSTVGTSSWNTESSYGGSSTSSQSETTSYSIADKICETTGYGVSYIKTEDQTKTEGNSSTQTGTEEYSVTTTYSTVESESVTRSWTTQSTKPGYHRWVIAGTMHVFAIVGYNLETMSYFVSTYSVMDDYTYEFEDYSYTTANYNDNQNGVISFDVPYDVAEYISELTSYTRGLKIDQSTGVITGYEGTDNCVVIPEYMPIYNYTDSGIKYYDIVKVTGISSSAFAGNDDIVAVVLSDYITEIPEGAFAGCTALRGIIGGSISNIGKGAFSGCSAIECAAVRTQIVSLGENAFVGVNKLYVNASSADVFEAATMSGASQIVTYTKYLEDSLDGKSLTIPSGTVYLAIYGNDETLNEFTLASNADKTVLSKLNFVGGKTSPLKIYSPDVVLNQVTVKSTGIGVVLYAETVNLGLQGNVTITTDSENSMLCKNLSLYESSDVANGRLSVSGRLRAYPDIDGAGLLVNTRSEEDDIDEVTFDNLLNSYTLTFDACDGGVSEAEREAYANIAIGELPTPTRDYYDFDGWFTEAEGGEEVTAESSFVGDTTIYAHWTANAYTLCFDANQGECTESSRMPFCGVAIGELPTPTRTGFDFAGWFTEAEGGEQVTEETVYNSADTVTIYAHWTAIAYTVSWNNGTGYSIAVSRTSSPYANAATGALSNGDTVYYGDVLSVSYNAATGYSIGSKGSTSITVDKNVTSDDIWATATPNNYTYTIKYVSSNGTVLGSIKETHPYGTGITLYAPSYSGYNTPGSQYVVWDSVSGKTITFTYYPSSVATYQSVTSGNWWTNDYGGITYSVAVEYQNRTATTVQARLVWTQTIKNSYYGTNQYFNGSIHNASVGDWQIASSSTWYSGTTCFNDSQTITTNWVTVTGLSTSTTSVGISGSWWDSWRSGSWSGTLYIPTY